MAIEAGPFDRSRPRSRASAPVGVVLLLALAALLAGGVGAATLGDGVVGTTMGSAEPAPTASLSVAAAGDRVTLTHRGGEAIDVDRIRLRVAVDGDPLTRQPPVPFFSATGFKPGPTGAFNSAGTTTLRGGETASFRVAETTNGPDLSPGASLSVRVYVGDTRIAALETMIAETE